ncbi:hypothetical protein [Agromyces arachidis]|uniref:hypothetical protein n=1 Tax=Agromyces arachidis TaxID=766966 RepID=UPI0040565F12
MRWDRLFDDLESQLDLEEREARRALELESERLRLARLGLRDRLLAMAEADADGAGVRVELVGGRIVQLRPAAFGRDWVSGAVVGEPGQVVVPMQAVTAISASRRQVAASLVVGPGSSTRVAERIGLAFVLRDLSRRRLAVDVDSADGCHHGTIDRVGLDHLDLALHERGAPRRERDVRGYRLVPFDRVVAVGMR